MMNRCFCTILLILPFFLFAQQTEGEVSYKETIQLNIELPPDVPEEMKKRIPKERTFPKVLYFNQEASIYKDVELSAEEGPGGGRQWREQGGGGGGGMRIRMGMRRPQNTMYKDLAEGTKVEQRDIMDKKFLIEDDQKKYTWKLAMEQKEIQGFLCQKATYQDTSIKIEVWFTPQIPVSTGPGNLGGLPGLILEASYDDGRRVVTMEEIKLDEVDKENLERPTKGKKVTQKEFETIREEKMEEMRKEFGGRPGGGRGGRTIIIRSN